MTQQEQSLWAAYQADRSIENRNKLVDCMIPIAHNRFARVTRNGRIGGIDDLRSEAFLSTVEAVETFSPDRGSELGTWVRNHADWKLSRLSRARKRQQRGGLICLKKADKRQAKDAEEPNPLRGIPLSQFIEGLNEQGKQIMKMRFEEGLGIVRIARRLGKSKQWISTKFNRDLQTIRNRWLYAQWN